MYIPQDQLRSCLEKVDEIAAYYMATYIGADDPVRSIDNLKLACETYLNVRITLFEGDTHRDETAVWGAFIKKPDGYDIVISQGHNYCWRRFVTCKELFHVVLDKEEYRNMDIEAHVNEVTVTFPDHHSRPGVPVMAEMLAEISAMEFLFPYRRRQQALVGQHKDNFLAIAEMHKVPQVHVEKYLSPSYMEALLSCSKHD